MTDKESVDPQIEDFILSETQKQRFQSHCDEDTIMTFAPFKLLCACNLLLSILYLSSKQVLVHGLTDTCWETCMGRPSTRLDSKTETCIMNCVERFIDSTTFITRRLMNTTKYRSDAPLEFQ